VHVSVSVVRRRSQSQGFVFQPTRDELSCAATACKRHRSRKAKNLRGNLPSAKASRCMFALKHFLVSKRNCACVGFGRATPKSIPRSRVPTHARRAELRRDCLQATSITQSNKSTRQSPKCHGISVHVRPQVFLSCKTKLCMCRFRSFVLQPTHEELSCARVQASDNENAKQKLRASHSSARQSIGIGRKSKCSRDR